MPPPNLERFERPTKLLRRHLQEITRAILDNWIVSSPSVKVRRQAGGTCYLEVVGPGGGGVGLWVRTPGGGIAGRSGADLGSAECALLGFSADGERITTEQVLTVHNNWTGAIPGGADLFCSRSGPLTIGLIWECGGGA
jgi:hypothetical protein